MPKIAQRICGTQLQLISKQTKNLRQLRSRNLTSNENVTESPNEMAHNFNTYFNTIGENLANVRTTWLYRNV